MNLDYIVSFSTKIGTVDFAHSVDKLGYYMVLEVNKSDRQAYKMMGIDLESLPVIDHEKVAGIPRMEIKGFFKESGGSKEDLGEFVADYYAKIVNLPEQLINANNKKAEYNAANNAYIRIRRNGLRIAKAGAVISLGAVAATFIHPSTAYISSASGLAIASGTLIYLLLQRPKIKKIIEEMKTISDEKLNFQSQLQDIYINKQKIDLLLSSLDLISGGPQNYV